MVETVYEKFDRIDILVNNAGIVPKCPRSVDGSDQMGGGDGGESPRGVWPPRRC